jgi:hypothetical protein
MSSGRVNPETDLLIRVGDGRPLQAKSLLVRGLCDIAEGLPAAADTWDVSGLLLDGQPFSGNTVSCWLSCAHSAIHGLEELRPQEIQQLSTVTGLTQVLAFANAVGSYAALCKTACSQLQQLKFVVQLPEQMLELPVVGYTYRWEAQSPMVCLAICTWHPLASPSPSPALLAVQSISGVSKPGRI